MSIRERLNKIEKKIKCIECNSNNSGSVSTQSIDFKNTADITSEPLDGVYLQTVDIVGTGTPSNPQYKAGTKYTIIDGTISEMTDSRPPLIEVTGTLPAVGSRKAGYFYKLSNSNDETNFPNGTYECLSDKSMEYMGNGGSGAEALEDDSDSYITIVFTGQSNAMGRALNSSASADELAVQSSAMIWNNTNKVYEQLNIGSGNNNSDAGQHGIELGLAKYFRTYFPNKTLRLIKYGVGGTCIDEHLEGGSVYNKILSYTKAGLQSIINEGKMAEVYFLFLQGECDSNTDANTILYQDKLNTHLQLWQGNLGIKLPYRNFQILQTDNRDKKINNCFVALSKKNDNVEYFLTKNMSSYDGLHFDYNAFKEMSILVLKNIKRRRSNLLVKSGADIGLVDYKLKFDYANIDRIELGSRVTYTGFFYVEAGINITALTGSNFVSIFSGGTEANANRCRFLINTIDDRIFVTINENNAETTALPIDLGIEYTIRLERNASNEVYVTVNNGVKTLIGTMTGDMLIDNLFNDHLYASLKGFSGYISYIDLNGDKFEFTEATGTTVTTSNANQTGTILTTQDLAYINKIIWQ